MSTQNPFQPSATEIARRYANTRKAMAAAGLDALIVSGSEYRGFEGAVRYMCGFHILHRYAYVVVPMKGDPIFVTPREATWVGDHSPVLRQSRPPSRLTAVNGWPRIAASRAGSASASTGWSTSCRCATTAPWPMRDLELVDFDVAFDHSRAQKSEEEMVSVATPWRSTRPVCWPSSRPTRPARPKRN